MNAANLNKTVRYMKKHKTILPAYHNLWKLLCLSAYLLATMYLQSCINRPSSYTCDLDALETTPIAYKSSIYKNVKLVFLDSYPPISSIKKMLENVPGYETQDVFVQNAKVNSIRGQTSFHICHNDTVHCLTVLCRDSIH